MPSPEWVSTVKAKKTGRREDACDRRHDRPEIVHIDKDIGGEDEIVCRAVAGLCCEEVGQIGGGQTIIEAFALRLRDHAGREIDAHQPFNKRTKGRAGEPGAAAEIEHGGKMQRSPRRARRVSTASRSSAGPR